MIAVALGRDRRDEPHRLSRNTTGVDRRGARSGPGRDLPRRWSAGDARVDRIGPSEWHNPLRRGVAQSGSALALGARCRRFESSHPDQLPDIDAPGRTTVRQFYRVDAQPLLAWPLLLVHVVAAMQASGV